MRQHLLRNGRLFAQRANAAREGIADSGWRLIHEGQCILTHGASRSVVGILERAVQNLGAAKFKVIYVREETRVDESDRVVRELRSKGIPVAEIAEASVAYVMGLLRQVDMVIVGAEAVTSNGGIISRMGTLQLSKLAAQAGLPFYVAAETHKFARKFVMDQRDIGFKQEILDFSVDNKSKDIVDAVDFTVCGPQIIAIDQVANKLNSPLISFPNSSQRMGLSFLAMCLSSFSISMVVSTVERNSQSTGSAAPILMSESEWCVFIQHLWNDCATIKSHHEI